jgi:competence protein ComEA
MKQVARVSLRHICIFLLVMLISAALIPESGAAPAKASAPAAADLTKAIPDAKTTVKSSAVAAAPLAPGTKININTADQAMLQTLPDIGPVKAKAIIAGRPYKSVEEVMKISGIKEKTFAAIKNYITVK